MLLCGATLMSLVLTMCVRWIGRLMQAHDGHGVAGQVKAPIRRVPNIGGIAIFLTIALPIVAIMALVHSPLWADIIQYNSDLPIHGQGLRDQTPVALWFLAGLLTMHVMGLLDDRHPLPASIKLPVMLCVAGVVCWQTDSRLLTLLDPHVGGPWLSLILTVVWVGVVTNAMNFMDNMDGLSAGVAAIAGACFMAATMTHAQPQWFIAGCLALVVGACVGFLFFNYPMPRATVFMGDGGSLVLGFALAILTVRSTYVDPTLAGGWYGVLMPLMVLAVPLYDFASVVVLRLSQGKSPFVGDLQHLSHRLVQRGLSRRASVVVIHGLTGITALGAIMLGTLKPWQALILGSQTMLVLLIVAIYERKATARTLPVDGQRAGADSASENRP